MLCIKAREPEAWDASYVIGVNTRSESDVQIGTANNGLEVLECLRSRPVGLESDLWMIFEMLNLGLTREPTGVQLRLRGKI
jgi:hypothetical protein